MTCKCGHPPRQIGMKWGRLSTSDSGKTARLKCLACGWRWTSSAKYSFGLPPHTEDSRKGMTWEHILIRLFVDRDLRVDPITSVVESCRKCISNQNGEWRVIRQVPDSHNSGYRFVEVSYAGMKRKIGVHVLQWIQARGSETSTGIPDGQEVHHSCNTPRPVPKNNALSKLSLLPWKVNRSLNGNGVHNDF